METPAFRTLVETESKAGLPVAELVRRRLGRRHVLLGMGSRLVEGIAFNAWAVFAIAYGTGRLKLPRQTLLVAVMAAAGVMVVFIPLSGAVSDRVGLRRTFAVGAIVTGALTYPAFVLLDTAGTLAVTVALVAMLGVFYPLLYGPQAAFYAGLFPTRVRYTGISFVYQFSGIFASGLTPLILSSLVTRAGGGYTLVVLYMVGAAVVSVLCTVGIRSADMREAAAGEATAAARVARVPG